MKFNKINKLLLSTIAAGTLFGATNVFASEIKLQSVSTTSTEAKYELYVNTTDAVSGLSVTVTASNPYATKVITKADNVDASCDGNGCSNINIDANKEIKIATITLSNTTQNQIDNLTITAVANGLNTVTTNAVSLAGKVTEPATTQPKLSSNANITGLTISVGTLSPAFQEGERNYTITGIKDTINSITFNPTCDNCTFTYTCKENCSVSQTKNNKILLEEGANIIKIVTDSQDQKNSNEYTFTVYRGEIEQPSAYLKDLSIKDVAISPKFDSLLNDYTAKVDKDVEKLEINYTLEDPKATIEIKGADKLKDGENTITITVTSSDSKSKQVYTIVVTREDICDPEKEDCDKDEAKSEQKIEKKKTNKVWLIVLLSVVGLAIIVGSWFLLFKKKKNKNEKNDKNDKNNKSSKGEKLKNLIVDPEEDEESEETELAESEKDPLENDLLDPVDEESVSEQEPEIIKPKIKPSVDDALEDLMKTKEIELKDL